MEKEPFKKDNYFKIDVEAHIWPDVSDIKYYPGVQYKHVAFSGVSRVLGIKTDVPSHTSVNEGIFPMVNDPDTLIERMDIYGTCIFPDIYLLVHGWPCHRNLDGMPHF